MAPDPRSIAVIGAGPTGLEAALAAAEHGLPFTLYEASRQVAGSIRSWGHVRLFSPWDLDVSPRMRRALEAAGRPVPSGAPCPTGDELVDRLLLPVAELPEVAAHLRLGTRVLELGRRGLLKHEEIGTAARAEQPFRLVVADEGGEEWAAEADVVLDCSGTYTGPNRLGDGGIAAPGERALEDLITRTIPDFETETREWVGKTILLVGAGHSAQTAAVALAALAESHPGTQVLWALRRDRPAFTADPADPLPERARLVRAADCLAGGDSAAVEAISGVTVESLVRRDGRAAVTLRSAEGFREVEVDRILSLTGFVGDHSLYRQLQVHECYASSGPMKLSAALLGAGSADCLDQQSHGADTLVNPEPDFYILGSKSYGRNTTFLIRVGWQQVDEVFGLLG